MRAGTRATCLLAALLGLCACARDENEVEGDAERVSIGTVLAESLFEGPGLRREARKLPREKLLGDLVAAARPVARPEPVPKAAELDALARRLDLSIPRELADVLQTPGAIDALHWLPPVRMKHASALGADLTSMLRARGKGDGASVTVEDFNGGSFQLPLADVRGYLVVSHLEIFDTVLLYDPTEPPRHACCRLIESPLLRNDTATGYRDLGDWLVMEWSLLRMRSD